ncbi:hypothetical protein BDV32DRAFT_157369 [Aspergillus pseudonomiae]|uniref:Uncharacterized protein n=1 Tax=Aspergillus pseudonomiae TaxID=1506151 RepID=A0A5N6HHP4_9EURO|nr:uncharacterized protein BDV37DRAFT_61123 [Aspergillus pseudonomiae]KAB8253966.1 hypothetical protein BDV32DRAFT_157369 [Aspergillus pseudonomiae]KAE8397285.1 hypothetical protein BDV37DRAFT_61123 [Aspergillus pseudonomiae]
MATAYHPLPGELNAFRRGRKSSQTSFGLPPPSPQRKRASSFYPPRDPVATDETNPFYLERSLEYGAQRAHRPGARDVRFSEEANQYYMLSALNPGKELPFPVPVRGETARSRTNINRSTLSVVELEHQLALQQIAPQPWGQSSHYSQGSFGSVQTEATPDLTPSSSFSSNYSAPIYPDDAVRPSEQSARQSHKDTTSGSQKLFYPSTPRNRSRTAELSQPSTPPQEASLQTAPSNASSDTLVMPQPDALDSHRGKPLPSLPAVARNANTLANRRAQIAIGKPPIEACMISPPCRINPVTMEPHTTRFDETMFIPANDCPSPVPSPGSNSPSMDRPAPFARDRPSTSTSEVVCEHSVWESDSDSEDVDPKSLSRKPMDTLKKVRSRVHLRVAKSAPKLQNSSNSPQALEKCPTTPDKPPEDRCPPPVRSIGKSRLSPDKFPSVPQTVRIVAPSTTSLVPPRTPRSRRNSKEERPNFDIDRSTAAAMQAKSRRKPRSNSPQSSLSSEGDKIRTLCREERSEKALQRLTPLRQPLYKRVWESLRVLGCHGDIPPPRPRKAM